MNKKIATLVSTALPISIIGCGILISMNMYFVYMSGYNITHAQQVEEDIYAMRTKILTMSGTTIAPIQEHRVAVSHLVVIEPLTVSVVR